MKHPHAHHDEEPASDSRQDAPDFWRSRYALGLVVIGAAALYFLLTEHRAHFFSALPLLILLACPLMHVFMHGGHGGHGGHGDDQGSGAKASRDGEATHGCCAPGQDKSSKPHAAQKGETP